MEADLGRVAEARAEMEEMDIPAEAGWIEVLDIMGKAHALLEQLSESADDQTPPAPRKKR